MENQDIILLTKEIDEHHQYTRTNIQLLVQWFIFFVTANYVVFGLFAAKILEGALKSRLILYIATGLYFFVSLLGVILCLAARKRFKQTRDRIIYLYRKLQELQTVPTTDPIVVLPHGDYSRVMLLMALTLLFMLITWVAVAVVVGIEHRNGGRHGDLFSPISSLKLRTYPLPIVGVPDLRPPDLPAMVV